MFSSLFQYQQLDRATWMYVSSMMTIALYFKFNRVLSVRNLDVVALVALAPGVVLATSGGGDAYWGYLWLFAAAAALLLRLLCDPLMVRRPLLEPNLLPGGLTFMSAMLMGLLFLRVFQTEPVAADLNSAERCERLWSLRDTAGLASPAPWHGPGLPLLYSVGELPVRALLGAGESGDGQMQREHRIAVTRTMAILSQLAIVAGLVLVGFRHFGNIKLGLAAGGMYLLAPYTAQHMGRVDHALPAALVVWAVVLYRRPALAGVLLGLTVGATWYPLFLLPLWLAFYWQRGLWRFVAGLTTTVLVVVGSLALTSSSLAGAQSQLLTSIGWYDVMREVFGREIEGTPAGGFWAYHRPAYRITVFAMFLVLCGSFALWPARKNLGTLLSCSAAVMLATQFWHPQGGGLYVAWWLPLVLLTVFRPNLEDRVATSVITGEWLRRRKGLGVAGRTPT